MNDFFENVGAITLTILLIVFVGGVLGSIGYSIINFNAPPAIEVYRGNTTLEVTYKDGIPVDSVVVYKSKSNK